MILIGRGLDLRKRSGKLEVENGKLGSGLKAKADSEANRYDPIDTDDNTQSQKICETKQK